MKKLIIFIAMIFIASLVFSVDVIVSAPEGIFHYELEDIYLDLNDGLVFQTTTHKIIIPSIFFPRINQIVFDAKDFFESTEPREGYVIIQPGRVGAINYMFVSQISTNKIEALFPQFRVHMYWLSIEPEIDRLMGN